MNSEFDIIKQYFTFSEMREDVLIAGGDDCASIAVAANKQLLVTVDTLISGVHFPHDTLPQDIAYKAVMVNLSDLAAMGAKPAWITLALTLPEIEESWLEKFSQSLRSVLKRYNVSLIGGDTTKGDLSITIQAMGLSGNNGVLRRDQAKPGDLIFVTGDIGAAAIGLHAILNKLDDKKLQPCITQLNRPEARVAFAQDLCQYSNCAIDVSDGLFADLGHILDASGCGAKIFLADIVLSSTLKYYFEQYRNAEIDWQMLLSGGDDYELCFTAKKENSDAIKQLAEQHQLKLSCIGKVESSSPLSFFDAENNIVHFSASGFKHF